jgi:hypothetical protein
MQYSLRKHSGIRFAVLRSIFIVYSAAGPCFVRFCSSAVGLTGTTSLLAHICRFRTALARVAALSESTAAPEQSHSAFLASSRKTASAHLQGVKKLNMFFDCPSIRLGNHPQETGWQNNVPQLPHLSDPLLPHFSYPPPILTLSLRGLFRGVPGGGRGVCGGVRSANQLKVTR